MGGGYSDAVATGTGAIYVAMKALELKKNSEKKEKVDKSKTVAELDRDKLDKKFSKEKEKKLN